MTDGSMVMNPTVFVIEDGHVSRTSLRGLLEASGHTVETYPSSDEFLRIYRPDRPGCLVLVGRLKDGAGLDLHDELRRRRATIPVIMLAARGNGRSSARAANAGAVDILEEPVPPAELLEHIDTALETDRRLREVAAERAEVLRRFARLTARERVTAEMLIAGKDVKEIAAAMKVSARTVESRRRAIFLTMNVASAAQLVRVVVSAREGVLAA